MWMGWRTRLIPVDTIPTENKMQLKNLFALEAPSSCAALKYYNRKTQRDVDEGGGRGRAAAAAAAAAGASLRGLPRGRSSAWGGLPVGVASTLLEGGKGPWLCGQMVVQ
ncbi:hypothetical protein EYF80_044012 [Liparis tanakae]|uniref:Uncharacterized protein n=1 Tax=Liparis tanakae TaxID=230148 RepID=A0A4Z2FZK7_9TELE|nr:hypothetical protein EYF80_044012 [Liparis tanakae]